MDLQEYLDQLNQGKTVVGGSPAHQFMHQLSQQALAITGQLNTGYHTPEEIRQLFSQLIGKPVDETFALFPRSAPTAARTSPWASGSFSTPAAGSRTRAASASGTTSSSATTWSWPR